MLTYAEKLAQFCESNIELKPGEMRKYHSLSVCVLECVYSLRAKYGSATHVVDRYAASYMDGSAASAGDTISMLLERIDKCGGPGLFADKVLKNHQKIRGISKADVCYQLAYYLRCLRIETIEDFRNYESQELLEVVLRGVKGMGDAGVSYLFMLTGDPNRCKPDVHIHHCVRDACGMDMCNKDCQTLFTQAVELLQDRHKGLTVRDLDYAVWSHYRRKKGTC